MQRAIFAIVGCCSCAAPSAIGRAHVISDESANARVISIVVTRDAFTPDRIHARVGEHVGLRFERSTTSRCAREVIITLDSDHEVRRELLRGKTTQITLELDRAGEIGFSCSMHMLGGAIVVEP